VRGSRLDDRASFFGTGPWLFRCLSPERNYAYCL